MVEHWVLGDLPVFPRRFLSRTRTARPDIESLIDEAEIAVASAEALGWLWRDQFVRAGLEDAGARTQLRWRTGALVVLAVQRTVELSDGLAREIEADSPYPAVAIARALAEVAALTCFARRVLPEALGGGEGAASLVAERLLLGSRFYSDLPRNHAIPELINAARDQLGDDFGANYGWLSEQAHPNALMMGAFDEQGEPTFDRRSIGDDRAESLVHMLGHGARIVAHNGCFLTDWADEVAPLEA